MSEELKPCKECGGEPETTNLIDICNFKSFYRAQCEDCQYFLLELSETEEEAIEAWNKSN